MNMMSRNRGEKLIAKRYEEQGYVVVLDPPSSAFPFSLGSYQPDILATRGDEHIVIAVKSAGAAVDPDAYLRLDQEIQRHAGWRFLLATVNDAELQEQYSEDVGNITIQRIQEYLEKIDRIAETEELAEFVLPQLWIVYLSALKLLALRDGVGVEDCSDLSFLNQAYANGILSFDDYESARRLLNLRNHAAHSLDSLKTTISDWRELRTMVDALLTQLSTVPASASQA